MFKIYKDYVAPVFKVATESLDLVTFGLVSVQV